MAKRAAPIRNIPSPQDASRILIIYAHPSQEGHCATILYEVEGMLQSKNLRYTLLDLYHSKYDPLLRACELYGRDVALAKDTKKYQQLIANAKQIIFIYPVWWNSMPAILKGFIDRVFSAGFAFRYKPIFPKHMMPLLEKIFRLTSIRFDYGIPIGLLKEKKATVFLTTGSPKYLAYLWNGNRFKKIIKNDMMGFFGIKATVHQIGNCRTKIPDVHKRAEIQRVVQKALHKFQ